MSDITEIAIHISQGILITWDSPNYAVSPTREHVKYSQRKRTRTGTVFHQFEYIIFEEKWTFEMLTVCGQQHSFSTHDRVFFWKCQSFSDRKCLDLRGTRTLNLRIHAECWNLLSYQGQTFAVPCFWCEKVGRLVVSQEQQSAHNNCPTGLTKTQVGWIEHREGMGNIQHFLLMNTVDRHARSAKCYLSCNCDFLVRYNNLKHANANIAGDGDHTNFAVAHMLQVSEKLSGTDSGKSK